MKRWVTLYFPSFSMGDVFWALVYLLRTMLFIPFGQTYNTRLNKLVKKKFPEGEPFFYGSARSALYSLLLSLQLPNESEVLVTGYTCFVVPNSVIQAGLKPVYMDISLETYGPSAKSAADLITEKTKVIIIQHTYGIPAEVDELLALAKKHDLYVIEDCAVSLGSYYKGKLTGSFGDAAIFSFELSKLITCCWGGMLLLNSDKLGARSRQVEVYKKLSEPSRFYVMRALSQLAISGVCFRPIVYNWGRYVIALGFKFGFFKKSTTDAEFDAELPAQYMFKLSAAQRGILCRQWLKIDKVSQASQQAAQRYYQTVKDLASVVFAYQIPKDSKITLCRYPVRVLNRATWQEVFSRKNIELGSWFVSPLSSLSLDEEKFYYQKGSCPSAELVSQQMCNLPTHVRLSKQDLDTVTLCSRTSDLKLKK